MVAQLPDQTRTKEQYFRTEVKIIYMYSLSSYIIIDSKFSYCFVQAELKVIESWYAMSPMARERLVCLHL